MLVKTDTIIYLNRPVLLKGKPAFAHLTYSFFLPFAMAFLFYRISVFFTPFYISFLIGTIALFVSMGFGVFYVGKAYGKDENFFNRQIHEIKIMLRGIMRLKILV